jgi:hypothetical protein
VQGLGQGDVASVGERCDDETVRAAEELVRVAVVHVADGDLACVRVLDEVEATLFKPLEVLDGLDTFLALDNFN